MAISHSELQELKDQVEMFEQNPIWQHILGFMQKIYMDSAEEVLNNPEKTIDCAKASGRAQAVRLISDFKLNIGPIKAAMGVKNNARE